MLYKFVITPFEITKSIFRENGEDAVDPSTVIRYFTQVARSLTISQSIDSEAIEANQVSNIQRVSSEFSISQSSMVHYFHDCWSCQIVPHIIKVLQNLLLTQALLISSLRIFELLTSSSLLYLQRFSQYVHQPSLGISCRIF